MRVLAAALVLGALVWLADIALFVSALAEPVQQTPVVVVVPDAPSTAPPQEAPPYDPDVDGCDNGVFNPVDKVCYSRYTNAT